jgi:predicted dinucleotide-binding enzyme
MRIAVIGTGFIGGTLGRAFARAGHEVVFGSRRPGDTSVTGDTSARVDAIERAVAEAEIVVVTLPGPAVDEFLDANGPALAGRILVDVANRMGQALPNSAEQVRAKAPDARYARAFSTLGGEMFEDPIVGGERADLFFSADEDARAAVERLIEAVGLRPVYVGADQHDVVDGIFRLYFAMAIGQKHGRRTAFKLLTDEPLAD